MKPSKERMRIAAQSLVRRARAGDQNAIGTIVMIRNSAHKSPRAAIAYDILRIYIKDHPSCIETEGFEIQDKKSSTFRGDDKKINSAIKLLANRTSKAIEPIKYSNAIVNLLPRIGNDIQSSLKTACILSSGRDINEDILKKMVSVLDGDIFFDVKGKPIIGGMESVKKAGLKHAKDYVVEKKNNNIRIKPVDEKSYTLGFIMDVNGKPRPVSSCDIFTAAFNNAVYSDRVVGWAKGTPIPARKILQYGYTMGLAKRIQDIVRHDAKISTLSEMVAWELGE